MLLYVRRSSGTAGIWTCDMQIYENRRANQSVTSPRTIMNSISRHILTNLDGWWHSLFDHRWASIYVSCEIYLGLRMHINTSAPTRTTPTARQRLYGLPIIIITIELIHFTITCAATAVGHYRHLTTMNDTCFRVLYRVMTMARRQRIPRIGQSFPQ